LTLDSSPPSAPLQRSFECTADDSNVFRHVYLLKQEDMIPKMKSTDMIEIKVCSSCLRNHASAG
jgi:hypothetical protein